MRCARYLSTIAMTGAVAFSVSSLAFAGNPVRADRRAVEAAASGDDVSVSGALHPSDPTDAGGHHFRTRTISLRAGEQVEVTAESSEFDTIVRVHGPNLSAMNDDASGGGTNSRLHFVAPATGRYTVTITSYNANETGEYQLAVRRGVADEEAATVDANNNVAQDDSANDSDDSNDTQNDDVAAQGSEGQPPTWRWDANTNRFVPVSADSNDVEPDANGTATVDPQPSNGTGNVFGVFVGVGNYDNNQSLENTTADARNLESSFEHAGLIQHGNGIVLTDAQATGQSIQVAFNSLSQRMTPNDTFVFFFDGHGNANEVELLGGGLHANELSSMLDGIHGRQMIVLDSCESGGFASIINGHSNRVGFFSSRASESSYVASAVHSGGWLAYFMIQAVRNGVHGASDDGALRVSELASYVQRGYDARVHGQQHLVVTSGAGRQAMLWHASHHATTVATNP